MIVTHIIGGLGNQMFQYAMGRALSLQNRRALKLDISDFENYKLHQGFELQRLFNAPISIATPSEIRDVLGWQASRFAKPWVMRPTLSGLRRNSFVVEPHFNYWPQISTVPSECYLHGYWQTEKYFERSTFEIREDFTFKFPLKGRNSELAEHMTRGNSVSLHVRRGDYVRNSRTNATHGVCSIEYYQSAIEYILERVKHPILYVFSDDIEWVKQNLRTHLPTEYIDHNQGAASHFDMRLMSLCRHHVIANSSFSWWGAWLNPDPNKIVIAPRKWFAANIDTGDLLPATWTRL